MDNVIDPWRALNWIQPKMSPESLITIISLALAVYALLPADRLLDLKIKLAWFDGLVILLGALVILYILYFPVFSSLGLAFDLGTWSWGFTPDLTGFTVFAIVVFWLAIRLQFGRLGRRRVKAFSGLSIQLLHQQRYDELAELLDRHWSRVIKIYQNDFRIIRLKNWLAPSLWLTLGHARTDRRKRPKTLATLGRTLARGLPTFSNSQDIAKQNVRRMVLHRDFVIAITQSHPYLGIKLLGYEFDERKNFQKLWLSALRDNPNSVLYAEIGHTQTMKGGFQHRFEYQPENRLLQFYFHNVRTAESLDFYQTIGEYLCGQLDWRCRHPSKDRFNRPTDRYQDIESTTCAASTVLQLFDYMISEALYQRIRWHMWLHYLPIFASKMLRNLDPAPEVDPLEDFPTPYHYLLYRMVDMLCVWIDCGKDVATVPDSEKECHILPNSVTALARLLSMLLQDENVTLKFGAYLLDLAMSRVVEWDTNEQATVYAEQFIEKIAKGGREDFAPENWTQILTEHLRLTDTGICHGIEKRILVGLAGNATS